MNSKKIMGYKRDDGRFGIRNYVIVISVVQCANSTAIQIAQKCDVPSITIETGCGEHKEQEERTTLGLITAGTNPNVHSVLIVSLGCQWTDVNFVMSEIKKTGKSVEHICIQDEGGIPEAVEKGVKIVERLKAQAKMQQRVECPLSGLVIGVQCGGSDWTTAISGNTSIGEMTDLLVKNGGTILMCEIGGFPGSDVTVASHAINHEVGCNILDMVDDLLKEFKEHTGQSISDVNPTPGNKEGGITTLCEKSMGNVKKMGTSPIQGIIKVGEIVPYPGVWILDQRQGGNDAYVNTGFAMCGAHSIVFCTGRGSGIGNAVMPVLKITGNPKTYLKMNSIIDFNAGIALTGEKTIKETGKDLYDALIDMCNGKVVKSEINKDYTYTIPHGNGYNG